MEMRLRLLSLKAAWSLASAGKLGYHPAPSELENAGGKCPLEAEGGEEAWGVGGGCALRTCRCFPGPCPSAAGSPGKPAAKKSIYSHLCRLVPAWLSSKHLRVPVPLADKTREGLEG